MSLISVRFLQAFRDLRNFLKVFYDFYENLHGIFMAPQLFCDLSSTYGRLKHFFSVRWLAIFTLRISFFSEICFKYDVVVRLFFTDVLLTILSCISFAF